MEATVPNIEFLKLKEGGVMLASDAPLEDRVKRVEYYAEQRLFMLVYQNDNLDTELMSYELPPHLASPVEKTPSIIICSIHPVRNPKAYSVPLIKVHN